MCQRDRNEELGKSNKTGFVIPTKVGIQKYLLLKDKGDGFLLSQE